MLTKFNLIDPATAIAILAISVFSCLLVFCVLAWWVVLQGLRRDSISVSEKER
jgi:hypothetical protein